MTDRAPFVILTLLAAVALVSCNEARQAVPMWVFVVPLIAFLGAVVARETACAEPEEQEFQEAEANVCLSVFFEMPAPVPQTQLDVSPNEEEPSEPDELLDKYADRLPPDVRARLEDERG